MVGICQVTMASVSTFALLGTNLLITPYNTALLCLLARCETLFYHGTVWPAVGGCYTWVPWISGLYCESYLTMTVLSDLTRVFVDALCLLVVLIDCIRPAEYMIRLIYSTRSSNILC